MAYFIARAPKNWGLGRDMKEYLIIDQNTTFIDEKTTIGKGVIIHPFCVIENSIIKDGAEIMPYSFIKDSLVEADAKVFASVIEQGRVGEGATVGPFAHLRPNANIAKGARIGNFVEIKNSDVGEGSKVSHLSYVGDASIGKGCNIGCGVVFVNYNGKRKERSTVGDACFVGSSVNVIAPVDIGEGAFVCAGTTVDKSVPGGAFVIGRSKMVTKENRAKNYWGG